MTLQALPCVLLQGFLFGSTLIASRFSVGQFHPTTYIGIRMVLARRQKWPSSSHLWRHAALLGVMGTAVPMVAIVRSLQYQSAGLTSVLPTSGPAVTVLMAHFFLADETLNPAKVAGVVLAVGGAMLLAVRGESGLPDVNQASPLGYGLVALAILSACRMTIYARRFMRDYGFFDVASVRIFVATLTVMPLSALRSGWT